MLKKISFVLVFLFVLVSCDSPSFSSTSGITGLPAGDFLAAYESSSGEYTINIYLCDGGATTDYSIRGELLINATGFRKNVYWNYHEYDAVVKWVDNETVTINNHTLNIHNEVYDFRRN